MSDRAAFVVSFSGPGVEAGRIDVRELAPALMSLGKLIDAANLATFGEKQPIKIEAKAVSEGSFEVWLEAISNGWSALNIFIDRPDVQHAKTLLEWIGLFSAPPGVGLITVYRFLRGKKPEKVLKAHANQFLIEMDGHQLLVPFDVMRLYQDIAVNKAFSQLISSVEGNNVNKIEFRPEGTPKSIPSLVLTKEDRISVSISEPTPVVVVDDTRRMALSIRSLAFQEGNKWRLFDGQNTITASIEDKEFIDRVDANVVRFAKGDVLICEVRTIQSQGTDGLKTEHTVIKVIEHKPAPTQIPLSFDPAAN